MSTTKITEILSDEAQCNWHGETIKTINNIKWKNYIISLILRVRLEIKIPGRWDQTERKKLWQVKYTMNSVSKLE